MTVKPTSIKRAISSSKDAIVNKTIKNTRYRPDAVDFTNRIIYELKPYNKRSYQKALKQTKRYADILGGAWTVVIDMYFEYDKRSVEDLERSIDMNIEKMLSVLSDKKYAFKDYQNNLDIFVSLSEHEIKKFIRLGAISKQKVLQHRIKRGYKDNSFLEELN